MLSFAHAARTRNAEHNFPILVKCNKNIHHAAQTPTERGDCTPPDPLPPEGGKRSPGLPLGPPWALPGPGVVYTSAAPTGGRLYEARMPPTSTLTQVGT